MPNFTKFHQTVFELFQVKDEILRDRILVLQNFNNKKTGHTSSSFVPPEKQ
jgi:hypothetical protein